MGTNGVADATVSLSLCVMRTQAWDKNPEVSNRAGIFDSREFASYVCSGYFPFHLRSLSMESVLFWVVAACACLVVGIYFFFVRTRPIEQPHERPQQ